MTTFSKVLALGILGVSASALAATSLPGAISGSTAGTTVGVALPPLVTSVVVGASVSEATASTSGESLVIAEIHQIAADSLEDIAVYESEGRMSGVLPAAIARVRELLPEKAHASDEELVTVLLSFVRTAE